MLNKSGITKTTLTNVNQILANVELQCSIGCIVPQSIGTNVADRKIVKAGTPITIDFNNMSTEAKKADAATNAMNAVLLHDVDVTAGSANGTALIFGFVNVSRVESDVAGLITTALTNAAASKMVTFVKM